MSPMSPRLLRPRASGTLDPRTISNLSAWWDFSDSSTVSTDGNPQRVASIADKSGSNLTASNNSAGSTQPLYTAQRGGKNVASFSAATSTKLTFSSLTIPTAYTIFQVWWRDSAGTVQVGVGSDAQASMPLLWFSDNKFYVQHSGAFQSSSAVTSTGRSVLVTQRNGSTSLAVRFNQTEYSLPAVTSSGAFNAIGNDNSGARFGTQDIGEILIYSRLLTSTELASVENYLLRKWT